ncbi:MAG: glycosyltransferase, partial [Verrucomicrobia bacterium]|nr:glycosyltransferase [Verrucomicrobiota bacterium]
MRVFVWGINYAPEFIGIAPCNVALCEHLVRMNNDVTMLTAFSYYPGWKKRKQDAWKLFGSETINGVRVLRCWHYVPERLGPAKRILHEFSFVVCSFLRALWFPKPDLWIVVSPPLLLALAIRLVSFLRGERYLLHLQDLQPDAAINLGMIRSTRFIRVLRIAESAGYHGAWRISVITSGMRDLLCKRGVAREKLILFPNGTHPGGPAAKGEFRAAYSVNRASFLVVYSGNIGVKQGLHNVVESFRYVRNNAVELVICGDGAEKQRLLEFASDMPNVRFADLLAGEDYHQMLTDANLMIVTLAPGSGSSFFPSKLFSACAAGKAIVAICDSDSELAQIIEKNSCGVVVPYGDCKKLA